MRVLLAALLIVPSPVQATALTASLAAAEARAPVPALPFSPATPSLPALTSPASSLAPTLVAPALAAVMAAEVLAGWLILPHFAAVPAGAESKYLMYLCYLVQNLTAFLAAVMSARAFRRR